MYLSGCLCLSLPLCVCLCVSMSVCRPAYYIFSLFFSLFLSLSHSLAHSLTLSLSHSLLLSLSISLSLSLSLSLPSVLPHDLSLLSHKYITTSFFRRFVTSVFMGHRAAISKPRKLNLDLKKLALLLRSRSRFWSSSFSSPLTGTGRVRTKIITLGLSRPFLGIVSSVKSGVNRAVAAKSDCEGGP